MQGEESTAFAWLGSTEKSTTGFESTVDAQSSLLPMDATLVAEIHHLTRI